MKALSQREEKNIEELEGDEAAAEGLAPGRLA
jgi:hypothetical protein